MSSYYIYKISSLPGNLAKNLEKIDRFDSYKEAKQAIKKIRNEQTSAEGAVYKIIFAESELNAEELLQEKREEPVIQEWEK